MSRMWASVLPLFSPAVSLNNVVRLLCDCEMTDSNLSQLSVSFLSKLYLFTRAGLATILYITAGQSIRPLGDTLKYKNKSATKIQNLFSTPYLLGYKTVLYCATVVSCVPSSVVYISNHFFITFYESTTYFYLSLFVRRLRFYFGKKQLIRTRCLVSQHADISSEIWSLTAIQVYKSEKYNKVFYPPSGFALYRLTPHSSV